MTTPIKPGRRGSVAGYLLAASPLLLTVLLYAYSLRLPFYLDDLPHLAMMRRYASGGPEALGFFWGGNGIYPYYRPVMFTVWKAGEWLAGDYDPLGAHLFNVFCYGLAAVVLGLLARRFVRGLVAPSTAWVAGLFAGIGFAVYPFSYQAVTLVGGLGHLTLALGAALSLYSGLRWLDDRGGMGALFLCWLGAFIAIFSHENGILLIGLWGLLIALLYGLHRLWQARTLWLLAPIALMTSLYIVMWFSIPKLTAPALRPASFFESLATLSQGLAFPVVALLRPFIAGDASTGLLLGMVVGVIGVTGLWLLARSRGLALRAGYGLLWYAAGILPAALLLLPDYVSGSSRLSLFAALGAALYWGALAAGLWNASWRRTGRLALAAISIFALLIAVRFLLARRDEHLRMSDYTWRLVELAREQQPQNLLLINAPDYVAPLDEARTFLRGGEGVAFIGELVTYEDLFAANGRLSLPAPRSITVNSLKQNSGYILFTHQPALEGQALLDEVRSARAIYLAYFEGDRFYPVYVGGADLPGANAPSALFGQGEIALTEGQASYSPQRHTVTVQTRWRVESPQAVKPGVYVFCDGQFIAQRDGAVWGGTYPFSAWSPGEAQTDFREISLPEDAHLGCLQVFTALYQESDGARWRAVDAATGAAYNDHLVPLPLLGASDAFFPFETS